VESALSLIGHSADVASVVWALLGQRNIAARLARLRGQSELTATDRAQLAALAALHDVGKINQGFQRRPFFPGEQGGHVRPVVAMLADLPTSPANQAAQKALFARGGLGRLLHLLADENGACIPLDAILAHHGSLPATAPPNPRIWAASDGYDPVSACADLVDAIVAWFPDALGAARPNWSPAFQHAFAGLVMLADWIGSDARHFRMPAGDVPDGVARFAWAVPVAERLLEARAIVPRHARAVVAGLAWECRTLTGHAVPSPAQAAMLTLAAPADSGRTCVIEDETGSGKTEAALLHFLDLFRQGVVDGMYFALPTRAAAHQIHGRIAKALNRLLGEAAPHVVLAMPGYMGRLRDDALPDADVLWPDHDARMDALWSSERPKRYLASCVAVGTIDQALMGGLALRHAQLRSSSMLRLLLVVDEVHASDGYMTAILRNLLDQHRRAGGHALLMSATLGAAARDRLLTPRGRVQDGEFAAALATPYPAVWTDAAAVPLPAPCVARPQKTVRVELATDWQNPAAFMDRAVAAARRGARVLVIRNTVRDVVAAQLVLEAAAPELSLAVAGPDGDVPSPHHARYAPEDRARLDDALELAYGKNRPGGGGRIAIASQTAEQSLDIDADLLLTDLCPADVLLQRIGRLHRHARRRPAGFETATAIVLAPAEDDLAASIGRDGAVRSAALGLGLVYPDLLGIVATRRMLAEGTLHIPSDNRRLVEGATHPAALRDLAEALGGAFQSNWEHMAGTKGAQVQAAHAACLAWNAPIAALPSPDERVVTRLGLTDRSVPLPEGTIGPFGSAISRLSVPGRWLGGVAMDAAPSVAPGGPGELVIGLGERRFIYDRLGLRPE
jgi:CRISPR-associated endonuclease/helicase Cas3